MYIPYEKGTSEQIKRIAEKHRIDVIFTKGKDLKSKLSMATKTANIFDEEGIVYSVSCGESGCNMKYIGQTGRKLEERIKEHERDARTKNKEQKISGLSEHIKNNGHSLKRKNIKILAREKDYQKRIFKEASCISKERKLMNKKDEKVEISQIRKGIL